MSDITNIEPIRQTFRQLAITALEASRALHEGMNRPNDEPPSAHRAALNRTLKDLTRTREGFMLALRASDVKIASELRDLIGNLTDWSWLEEIGLRWASDEPLERLSGQTLLYQHALIALGVLPRLPASAVTHPRKTYSDVPVPSSPGQTLSRLEELEHTIWSACSEPVNALPAEALRRTYGFFEATTWLIANHMRNIMPL